MVITFIFILNLGCILYLAESTMFFPEIRYGVFKKNETFSGLIVNDGLLSKVNISSRRRCGNLCLSHNTCTAFFHNFEVGSCQLHDISFRNVTPIPSPGTTLYEMVGNRHDTEEKTEVSCTAMGFQEVSTYCIKIVVASVSPSTAKQGCPNTYPGSALVKIPSSAKQSIIEQELGAIDDLEIVYIQGNRHVDGSTVTWLFDDDSEMQYTNWNTASSQPNTNDNTQLYIGMRKSAGWRWHDFKESDRGSYICELDLN